MFRNGANVICRFVIAIGAILSLSDAANNDDFYDFKVFQLGADGVLNCSNPSIQSENIPFLFEPIAWMLPNLTRVYETVSRHEIANENWTLIVSGVTKDDLGVYHCMMLNKYNGSNDDWYLVKVGLNAEGEYFENLWDKYWLNTVIAIASFFGFVLLTVVSILLYKFHWVPPEEEEVEDEAMGKKSADDASILNGSVNVMSIVNAYENPTFKSDYKNVGETKEDVYEDDEDFTAL